MTDHREIEELVGVRALDGLDEPDEAVLRRLRSEHGEDCEECRLLEDEYDEVAGRLAFALGPIEPRPGLEDEVVRRARAGDASPAPTVRHDPVATGRRDLDGAGPSESARDAVAARRSRGRDHVWARVLAAAAIAAALFLGGWFARGATSSVPAGSAARVVAFRGPVGELQVAYRPGTAGAYLFGSRLPAPGPGRVLEVWMIRGESVTSGACVTPSRDGSLAAFVDANLGGTQRMAVTEESASCPARPTTQPILTADLTSPAPV